MQVTMGNAAADGAAFNGWFVGALRKWAGEGNLPGAPFALRDSSLVEVKWGVHRTGETRVDWAACSVQRTMSLLIRGRFLLRFRSPQNRGKVLESRLDKEGDYAIWDTDVEHTWLVERDSVILTIRWNESGARPAT